MMKLLFLKLVVILIEALLLGAGCIFIGIHSKSIELGLGIWLIGLAFLGKK